MCCGGDSVRISAVFSADCRFETTPPYSELPPARPMRMETVMVERLRKKLKTQVHQTNYLRMRLGMSSVLF